MEDHQKPAERDVPRPTDVPGAITRLLKAGIASQQDIHGIGEAEIAKVEAVAGHPLPASYREFLEIAGRQAGTFLRGSHFFYPEVLDLRAYAEELLQECQSPFRLGSSDFVCFMHQGYLFDFMRGANDGPEVFAFDEADSEPKRSAPSFGVWLNDVVADEIHPRFHERGRD